MDVTEAQEAEQLRDENTPLGRLVPNLSLHKGAPLWVQADSTENSVP